MRIQLTPNGKTKFLDFVILLGNRSCSTLYEADSEFGAEENGRFGPCRSCLKTGAEAGKGGIGLANSINDLLSDK